MTVQDPSQISEPYRSILAYSESWPPWQRNALRRIVLNGALNEQDIADMEALCRNGHGVLVEGQQVPPGKFLSAIDCPTAQQAATSVNLRSLEEPAGVNRLPQEPPLTFGDSPGLTVIFGENGTGKSGYARILKKACQFRGEPPDILPNAYSVGAGRANATIVFDEGQQTRVTKWEDGVACDPLLANVFVFDSRSAAAHVAVDGPAVFFPQGLDVLTKLVAVCDAIRRPLGAESAAIEAQIRLSRASWPQSPQTPVGKLLGRLNASTTNQEIEAAATLSEADAKRLKTLTVALNNDSKKKSAQTRKMAARLRAFAHDLATRETILGASSVETVQAALHECQAAALVAEAVKGSELDPTDLPGTYGDAWRQLWEIAREFALQAYPEHAFPNVDPDARCVLCQQDLDNQAKERFRKFDEYVADAVRARARAGAARVAELRKEYESLSALMEEFERVSQDFVAADVVEVTETQRIVQAWDDRLGHFQAVLIAEMWVDPEQPPDSYVELVKACAEVLDHQAQVEFEAHDPAERARLEADHAMLSSQDWLSKNLDSVRGLRDAMARRAKIDACVDDTQTSDITKANGAIYDMIVTKRYCEAFKEEMDALQLSSIKVSLTPIANEKGKKKFGIRLTGPSGGILRTPNMTVSQIASEGEHRCIALAAFLAELSQASHNSAVIFDDPVSSLDHLRRETVAERLVRESVVRQVIIFTHDTVFLQALLDASARHEVSPAFRQLSWQIGNPGFCEEWKPSDLLSYKERLDELEKEQKGIEKSQNPIPNDADKNRIRVAYSRYRATLESIIEEFVLSGSVVRYSSWVKVGHLKDVVGFAQSECDEILRLHKRACDVTEAHAYAVAKHASVPTAANLLADIVALKKVVEDIRNRRKLQKANASP